MIRLPPSLERVIQWLDATPEANYAHIERLLKAQPGDRLAEGMMLAVAWHAREGDAHKAQRIIDERRHHFPLLPIPLLGVECGLLAQDNRKEEVGIALVQHGLLAYDMGLSDLGLEAMSTGMIMDVLNSYNKILHDPLAILKCCQRYEHAAQQLGVRATVRPRSGKRTRIGLVVPCLVDNTVAFSNRVMFFARYMDTSQYELFVYVTESPTPSAPLLPICCATPPTLQRAPAYLNELRERGVPVRLASLEKTQRGRAQELAAEVTRDGIDVLILQSGPTMVVDWLATRMAAATAKLQIHIGMPAFQSGIDATLYDNAVNLEREAPFSPADAGEQLLVRRGTDIAAIDSAVPLSRHQFGIPQDAVVLGTLSNHINRRLTEPFLTFIVRLLRKHPNAIYLAIGTHKAAPQLAAAFAAAGIEGRAIVVPPQQSPGCILKMLDIYLNEFPAGGSQAVVEAIACGIPVVALRAGNTHHESIGADIVGDTFAIEGYDVHAYQQRASDWIAAPETRRSAGRAMRDRALAEFSVANFVDRVCRLGSEIVEDKKLARTA
jgi:hypothetical protein